MSIKVIKRVASLAFLATAVVAGPGGIDAAHCGTIVDRQTAGSSRAVREAWIRRAVDRILVGDAIGTGRSVAIAKRPR